MIYGSIKLENHHYTPVCYVVTGEPGLSCAFGLFRHESGRNINSWKSRKTLLKETQVLELSKRFVSFQALMQDFVKEGGWLVKKNFGGARGVWRFAPSGNF